MNWYLTARALCVVAFIAAVGCVFTAVCISELHESSQWARLRRWVVAGFAFALVGCVLFGIGWSPAT